MCPLLLRFLGQIVRLALGSSVFCDSVRGRASSWFPCGILVLCGWPRKTLLWSLWFSCRVRCSCLDWKLVRKTRSTMRRLLRCVGLLLGVVPWFGLPTVKWVSTKGKEKVAEDTRPLFLRKLSFSCLSLRYVGCVVRCSRPFRSLRGFVCASGSLCCDCWHPLFQVPQRRSSRAERVDRFSGSQLRLGPGRLVISLGSWSSVCVVPCLSGSSGWWSCWGCVVSFGGAPLTSPSFATSEFLEFFRLGRALRVTLPTGNGEVVQKFVGSLPKSGWPSATHRCSGANPGHLSLLSDPSFGGGV